MGRDRGQCGLLASKHSSLGGAHDEASELMLDTLMDSCTMGLYEQQAHAGRPYRVRNAELDTNTSGMVRRLDERALASPQRYARVTVAEPCP